jgi:hypothetical protein
VVEKLDEIEALAQLELIETNELDAKEEEIETND